MATPHEIDEEVARVMAQADAMVHAARYELDRAQTVLKKSGIDPSMLASNLSEADQAEVQRLVAEGRRQIEADANAARLRFGTPALGSQPQARKSRLMRNLV
jgi:ribosomal protein S13